MNLLFIKAGAAVALLLALVFGVRMWTNSIRASERALVVAEYNIQIDKLQSDARDTLADVTAKVESGNKKLRDAKEIQEFNDVVNTKALAMLADRSHALASAGMLIDPNAQACGCGSSGTAFANSTTPSAGVGNPAKAGGVLSRPLSQLLFDITRDADEINVAYISCRADALAIRAALNQAQ
jgi:hypothetical protein